MDKLTMSDVFDESSGENPPARVPLPPMTAAQLNEKVHRLTAEALVQALEDPELRRQPGVLQCALRFLVDNDVTGLDIPGSEIAKVKEAYASKAPFKLTGT